MLPGARMVSWDNNVKVSDARTGEAKMWDERKQNRLDELLAAKEIGKISESDALELQKFTDERLRSEANALRNATHNIEIENERTQGAVEDIEAQKRALDEMVREQETYLAEVTALVAQMENRRRSWRNRYKRLTGRSLKEPITTTGPR